MPKGIYKRKPFTEESKRKMSESRKKYIQNHPNGTYFKKGHPPTKGCFKKGHPSYHTKESKRKLSIANKGKKLSEEHRRKIGEAQKGSKHWHWKNGEKKSGTGYIDILKPDHPFCTKSGYVRRSHLVVEKKLGRYLTRKEIVHHINEIRDDDRIENFILFKNGAYHFWFHKKGFCNPIGIVFDGRKIK